MKKSNLFFASLVLMAFSCTSEKTEEVFNPQKAPVTVSVNDFLISQDEMTRATAVADLASVKSLTLAFYDSDGNETYKHTQLRDSPAEGETFGQFNCGLYKGTYTMVVIGSGSTTGITLTNSTLATYGDAKVQDTFVATKNVTISDYNAKAFSAELDRIVTRVGLKSTDPRPANVPYVRMTFAAGSKSFNPQTGLTASNTGFSHIIDFTRDPGEVVNVASSLFLATDEQTMDITVETLDANSNVLFSKTIEDVPLKRNCTTKLTGAIFTAGVVISSITVNDTWGDTTTIPF